MLFNFCTSQSDSRVHAQRFQDEMKKKNNNDMNLKPVLKASLAEIGRELKQDAYQISMC